jgi:nitrite reductase/ring-hydroxylating ferredoxin subunit
MAVRSSMLRNVSPVRSPSLQAPSSQLPRGWFAVAFSDELPRGAVVTRRALGRELVLFRTASGAAHALDAFCPHLGAHFGHGGTVDGERLRCPFHGFCFDGDGHCVSTPYGGKTPAIQAEPFVVREIDGIIFLHHDPTGAAPTWELPACDATDWSAPITRSWVLRSNPQEILENSVDFGHFAAVHRYGGVAVTKPLHIAGPYLTIGYSAVRTGGFFGALDPARSIRFANEIHTWGLGYSRVDITVERLGLALRQYVLPTPLDGDTVELRSATRVQLFPAPRGAGRYFQWLPRASLARLVGQRVSRLMDVELKPDFRIWENKRYLENPGLAQGDGPIGRYRRWARQFYVESLLEPSNVAP